MKRLPYSEMVFNLFKAMPTGIESLLHAAVGMSGEAAELIGGIAAGDRGNTIEELGDYKFYLVALNQILDGGDLIIVPFPNNGGLLEDMLIVHTGEVLDLVKKSWVYGRELDVPALKAAVNQAYSVYMAFCEYEGFGQEEIEMHNQLKLGKRYPEGVYADAAALARADKSDIATEAASPRIGAFDPLPIAGN